MEAISERRRMHVRNLTSPRCRMPPAGSAGFPRCSSSTHFPLFPVDTVLKNDLRREQKGSSTSSQSKATATFGSWGLLFVIHEHRDSAEIHRLAKPNERISGRMRGASQKSPAHVKWIPSLERTCTPSITP